MLELMQRGVPFLHYVGTVTIADTNPVTVSHGLRNHVGRPVRPIAVIPVLRSDGTTAPAVTVSVVANQTTDTEVVLHATGACTVDLYVY
jgi:hypothetical protein